MHPLANDRSDAAGVAARTGSARLRDRIEVAGDRTHVSDLGVEDFDHVDQHALVAYDDLDPRRPDTTCALGERGARDRCYQLALSPMGACAVERDRTPDEDSVVEAVALVEATPVADI